jgi:hypothetical protein
MINNMYDWKKAHKKALDNSKEGTHAWFKFASADSFDSCAKCGIIRRKDDKNKPCPGIVKVGLR